MPKPNTTLPQPKKAAPSAAKSARPSGTERDHDLPWNEKKVKLFKTLKTLKATGPDRGKTTKEVSEASGLSQRDVRHYSYHAMAGGLIALVENEGQYHFYLTAEGAKVNPDQALKAQAKKTQAETTAN